MSSIAMFFVLVLSFLDGLGKNENLMYQNY
jgi:hypothetical protein